jgi:hypothetical protein
MEQGIIKLAFEKYLPFVKIIKISGTVFEMCLPPRILTSLKNSKLEFCLPTIIISGISVNYQFKI